MNIVALPLDMRPYNYDFLRSLSAMDSRVTIQLPDKGLLGFKKTPADREALRGFVTTACQKADALIISLDMYLYGGLFPARVHHEEVDHLIDRLADLRLLKKANSALKIYGSSLVLRTPKYNSSEEEPSYYGSCGEAIFWYGYLLNKQQRIGLDHDEAQQLVSYRQQIADRDLADWLARRHKNLQVIEAAIALVAEGVLEILIIPLDDTAEFGFTAQDQADIYQFIAKHQVQERVFVHPGTDESGCTLLTRAYLDQLGHSLTIATLHSNPDFMRYIPNYEDRPFAHSLRSHAAACGITLSDANAATATCNLPLLAINGCGDKMQEAFAATYGYCVHTGKKFTPFKNVTYYTQRDLPTFAATVALQARHHPVVVADLAFSNGGETELIELLDRYQALDHIAGYAGWNTTCNSLGTALATLVFASLGDNNTMVCHFLQERLISDWAYQGEVRFPIQCEYLPSLGGDYADFDAHEECLFAEISARLIQVWHQHIKQSFTTNTPRISAISAPFKRLSGLHIQLA